MIIDTLKCDHKPTEFEIEISEKDVDLSERNMALVEASKFVVRVTRDEWLIEMKGKTSVKYSRRCDRCFEVGLGSVEIDFDGEYIVLADFTEETEATMKERGIDYSVLSSNLVDLKEIFADQLLVRADSMFLCRSDCEGLCGECGKRLNGSVCGCEEVEIDPRWAALKELREE